MSDTFRPEADKPRRSITKDLGKKYSLYAAVGRLTFPTVGFSIQSDVQAPLYEGSDL